MAGAEVHYLSKKQFIPVVKALPAADKYYFIESEPGEVISELREENYDFIIDLHHNLRSYRVKSALNRPAASFPKLNIEKWLYVNFKINRLPDLHIVDRYFKSIESLGVKNDGMGLEYHIPPDEHVPKSDLPASFHNGYIGFVIGAGYYTKQLPASKIISICKRLRKPVVLIGGKEDVAKGEEIKNATGDRVFNACGKYSINQSACLLKQAESVITNDTGMMHIAAALKKKVISVWGNTTPSFGMAPYMPAPGSQVAEVKNLSCRPCTKLGFNHCPKRHFNCMNKIDEYKIVSYL